MKKYLFLVLSFSALSFGCKKFGDTPIEFGKVQKDLPSFMSIYNFATDKTTSANFMLTTNSGLGITDTLKYFNININGTLTNKDSRLNEAGQINYFNNIAVKPFIPTVITNEILGYSKDFAWQQAGSLFGTKLKLKLHRGAAKAIGDTAVSYNAGVKFI